MSERAPARALIVVPGWRALANGRDLAARGAEAEGLARAIGLDVRGTYPLTLRQQRAATLLGNGQIAELAERIAEAEAELVLIDAPLTAIQQRNLETAWAVKVIDRTGLILEIFGERAVSAEGRLQVELAHLDYQAGRLVRSWTHLERQRGGYGFLGGPGETQIEADRRMIRTRITRIKAQLDESRRTRGLQRSRRQRAPWPVIALVGYTNAGKSTLFNALTNASVMAKDMMFATLDPAMRHIRLPGIDKAILSDTVGFVSNLPTELIAAFRATLEEVATADLIIHVRDISHADTAQQYDDVNQILGKLGIQPVPVTAAAGDHMVDGQGETVGRSVPVIELWNKADLLDPEPASDIAAQAARRGGVMVTSALDPGGVNAIRTFIVRALTISYQAAEIALSPAQGDALAWLHAHGHVEHLAALDASEPADAATHMTVRLAAADWTRFTRRWPDAFVRML